MPIQCVGTENIIALTHRFINSLPNDKIVDQSKLKTFAGDKISVTYRLKLVLRRLENIVRNGENAGYQNFLHFP